mmetsp:Transcript_24185/g.30426  ORF Transcript_24185/g.30426 Transcript_24185/m.30426 type:complete len:157 (+) Transcript_24185:566-1036(+)
MPEIIATKDQLNMIELVHGGRETKFNVLMIKSEDEMIIETIIINLAAMKEVVVIVCKAVGREIMEAAQSRLESQSVTDLQRTEELSHPEEALWIVIQRGQGETSETSLHREILAGEDELQLMGTCVGRTVTLSFQQLPLGCRCEMLLQEILKINKK